MIFENNCLNKNKYYITPFNYCIYVDDKKIENVNGCFFFFIFFYQNFLKFKFFKMKIFKLKNDINKGIFLSSIVFGISRYIIIYFSKFFDYFYL